jgi:hypothetical protein
MTFTKIVEETRGLLLKRRKPSADHMAACLNDDNEPSLAADYANIYSELSYIIEVLDKPKAIDKGEN